MRCVLLVLLIGLMTAAEGGGPSITPAPGFEPPKPGGQAPTPGPRTLGPNPQMVAGRPMPAYEVETLVLTPSDAASVGRWATLGALGYRVVATIPMDGRITLLLERMSMPIAADTLRLPAVITSDLAPHLRQQIAVELSEREKTTTPMRTAPLRIDERR